MPSKDVINILVVTFEAKDEEDFMDVEKSLDTMDLTTKYESLYGDKFMLD
jgi:hypothetical protein